MTVKGRLSKVLPLAAYLLPVAALLTWSKVSYELGYLAGWSAAQNGTHRQTDLLWYAMIVSIAISFICVGNKRVKLGNGLALGIILVGLASWIGSTR